MSTSTIEALASGWARFAEEAEFPPDYQGTGTPQPHRASEAIHEQIRERIVATNDMRLFTLLHLLLSLIHKTHPTRLPVRSRNAACGFKNRGGGGG
ncbi:hypothetical protein ACVGWL_00290, partial [Enterobacter asburiae]